MDYCSACRRHLNGALACPGCGSYAPSIAPLADGTPATVTAAWQAPSHLWHDAEPGAEEFDEAPQEHPYNGPDSPSPPTGRAARRRQRERWKKTQRRALVATAVALVGGGLTVSLTDQKSTDRTQAASAPDREAMGIAEKQATESTPASSTPTETRPSQRTSSATPSSTANAPHEQSAAAPQATPTTQQAGGTTPLATAASSAESQADSTVSDATDTATETAASPTPSATDSTGTGTSSTDTSSATSSPSDSSSPSGLCLLGLVCIS
ncbi:MULTISPECIES: hypothetical protein [unclassified Streptomyces]|uniref:SCO2400 family protein n=1 Tax=unclassified Streptomyces TaxID=2593676 RepID=UPI002DDB685D|nr:hypothetical protein [Streptomyces sp. NBC_00243]WRZ24176.1 hypothetical protein OHT59_39555 [Streptomyces sp. NBC_00243]